LQIADRGSEAETTRPADLQSEIRFSQSRRRSELLTSRERELLMALRGATEPSGSASGGPPFLRPISIALDPRGPAAHLTLLIDARGRGGFRGGIIVADGSGTQLQREVHRLAASVARLDPSLALVHVRVLVPLTDPAQRSAPELAFIATLDAASLQGDAALVPDTDLPGLFRDAWWGPPFTR
jgi:hypothetical protein